MTITLTHSAVRTSTGATIRAHNAHLDVEAGDMARFDDGAEVAIVAVLSTSKDVANVQLQGATATPAPKKAKPAAKKTRRAARKAIPDGCDRCDFGWAVRHTCGY